jgi:hypothetical protein
MKVRLYRCSMRTANSSNTNEVANHSIVLEALLGFAPRNPTAGAASPLLLGVKVESSPYAYNFDVLWHPDPDVLLRHR